MKKLIQIRGTNGVGKTTAVRNIIMNGSFSVYSVDVMGKEYPYTYDGKIAIGGRYDTRECGGLDGFIKDKTVMKEYITKLIINLKPEVLIIDAVMYGLTFKFAYELDTLCKNLGYHYIGLTFACPLDVALVRVLQRNGGKEVNAEYLQRKHFAGLRAYRRLRAVGVDVRLIDTSNIPKEKMHCIIEEAM